jgi:anaerobic dimethyl sulfoxide reductase subunit C (anchor subunit)
MGYLQDLPLALFTLLAQLAVGITLVGACITRSRCDQPIQARVRLQSLFALAFFAVAALISLGHTGTPLHGPYTILNFDSSWLSREIAMTLLTGLTLLWLAWLRFRKPPSRGECVATLLALAAGGILIYSMSCVYNQPLMPGWHSIGVFPSFLASTFLLGAAWHGVALSINNDSLLPGSIQAASPVLVVLLLGLTLMGACLPLGLTDRSVDSLNASIIAIPYNSLMWSQSLHGLITGLGALLLGVETVRASRGRGFGAGMCAAALTLVAVGELFGRLVFYLSYSRLGM